MKFNRIPRPEQFEWTNKKLAAHIAKPQRIKAKLEKEVPLLADLLTPVAVNSPEEEAAKRDADAKSRYKKHRDLAARQWRASRATRRNQKRYHPQNR